MYGKKVMGIERTTFVIGPGPDAAAHLSQGYARGPRRRGAGADQGMEQDAQEGVKASWARQTGPAKRSEQANGVERLPDARNKLLKRTRFFEDAAGAGRAAPVGQTPGPQNRCRMCWLAASSKSKLTSARTDKTPDPAAHSHRGPTPRNRPFRAARPCVCLLHLRLYYCMNFSCEKEGREGRICCARSSPLPGWRRWRATAGLPPDALPCDFTGGPAGLCQALGFHAAGAQWPRPARSPFAAAGARRRIPRDARAGHAPHRHPSRRRAAAALCRCPKRMCFWPQKDPGKSIFLPRQSVNSSVATQGPLRTLRGTCQVKLTSLLPPAAAVALMAAAVLAATTGVQAPQDQPQASSAGRSNSACSARWPADAQPAGADQPPGAAQEPDRRQVHEIMEGFAGSLGVHCDTCHAADPKNLMPNGRPRLNFADDSKPDKKIARIMITMTQQINKDYISKAWIWIRTRWA
jgi:hypothetical protein